MSKIILDASFLVALLDSSDVWHSSAVSLRDAMMDANNELLFLDCVANETVTVLGRRCERKNSPETFALLAQKFEEMASHDDLNWTYLFVKEQYKDILVSMKEQRGKMSFHDNLISLFAKQNGIKHIASFDEDFDTVSGLVRVKSKEDLLKES